MPQVDLPKIEKEWKARGFTFGIWNDPPGQVWENFSHGADELFMVVEGKVELEMVGRKFCPKIGEEVYIQAGVKHSVRNIGPTRSRWLYGYAS